MKVELTDLTGQYLELRDEVLTTVGEVLESSQFILGPEVEEFEAGFAAWCGVRHAIGVANGTDALTLAVRAFEFAPGAEVIVPVNTYIATAEAVVNAGATPVFVDVDDASLTIAQEALEAATTERTAAVIPVHLYGRPAEMEPLLAYAGRAGMRVIEDASQAHGAKYASARVGSFGDAACFSFYPSKNLGAYGDAGGIITDDGEIAGRLRRLRHHGGTGKFEHQVVGFNSRLDTLQAAILLVKMRHIDHWNESRRRHAAQYRELLSGIEGIVLPEDSAGGEHVYHLFVIRVAADRRDSLQAALTKSGVGTGIHYPSPLHLVPAFESLGHREGDFPVAEQASRSILSLPMYPELAPSQIEYVADQIRTFMERPS